MDKDKECYLLEDYKTTQNPLNEKSQDIQEELNIYTWSEH